MLPNFVQNHTPDIFTILWIGKYAFGVFDHSLQQSMIRWFQMMKYQFLPQKFRRNIRQQIANGRVQKWVSENDSSRDIQIYALILFQKRMDKVIQFFAIIFCDTDRADNFSYFDHKKISAVSNLRPNRCEVLAFGHNEEAFAAAARFPQFAEIAFFFAVVVAPVFFIWWSE